MGLLSHMMDTCLTLEENTKLFSRMAVLFSYLETLDTSCLGFLICYVWSGTPYRALQEEK